MKGTKTIFYFNFIDKKSDGWNQIFTPILSEKKFGYTREHANISNNSIEFIM